MSGIFIASGPAFAQGSLVEKMDNIDVYGLLCYTLKVGAAPNNGTSDVYSKLLEL